MKTNLSASIGAKLKNLSKDKGETYQNILTRYGLERFLQRLVSSGHGDKFLLKGAQLFNLWFDAPHRPTRDIDLLGFGHADHDELRRVIQDVCDIEAEDGFVFQFETLRVAQISKEKGYPGVRLQLLALLGKARCPIQVDIGYGDSVSPASKNEAYPLLLPDQFPEFRLDVYPVYSVIAEKVEAAVKLGIANSRMKDFYDIHVIKDSSGLEGNILQKAIAATFENRQTKLPCSKALPICFKDEFVKDEEINVRWKAFLSKNSLDAVALKVVIEEIRQFLLPVFDAIDGGEEFSLNWNKAGAWE